MSRKKIIIALSLGLLLLIIATLLGSRPHNQSGPINDGKEPETEILSMVSFSGDAKLQSLLAAPQLSAAKNDLSTYIHANYGSKIYTATIESTLLQDDGSIALNIDVGGGKTFKAVVSSTATQFIFSVPADNFQTTTPQPSVLNQYYGT